MVLRWFYGVYTITTPTLPIFSEALQQKAWFEKSRFVGLSLISHIRIMCMYFHVFSTYDRLTFFLVSFRFFLMTVFHERPPVISRVPRLNRVSVHSRPPLECDSIDSIWRFHMAPGQKLMMKLGMIRSNRARLGQLFWGFGTFWMWVSSNIITCLACGHIVSSYPAFQACDGVKRVDLAADLVTKSEKSWTKGFKIAHVRISTVKASLVDL